ncbi:MULTISPECIES: ATP-binding protein [unclassified Clostridium]|uniref:ATP-binding protein n=1 Tax=unclassified Clostridium TaxID=2614128 RepID=UPI0013F7EB96|nr:MULTISPECIES: ATP-binding protein [unclassified Clostridium]NFR85370.1 hypothetical protein [Clostridium botulinum]NFR90905.1 hypothetical protein [Clostridium botulinum]NFT99535.1 hypothetical protein [Clostridium botulinum]
MGLPVLVLGESGSGKSTSMRNFEDGEVGIFNVASKPLPFRKKLPKLNGASYKQIISGLAKSKLKAYVIDDSQYLMAFQMFDKAKETGYGKFTDIALDFRNLIQFIITGVSDDVIVYFLHHVETTETGKIKAKTSGKMIDNQLTLEGLFSIVLLTSTDGTEHKFITQSDGYTTAKSPMDMFPLEMDNDLKLVDKTIREYYELEEQ